MIEEYSTSNFFNDKLTIYKNSVSLEIKKEKFWDFFNGRIKPAGGGPHNSSLLEDKHLPPGKYSIKISEIKSVSISGTILHISADEGGKDISEIYRCKKYYRFFLPTKWDYPKSMIDEAKSKTILLEYLESLVKTNRKTIAKEKEIHLDYEKAIEIYDVIGENKEAARVRKLASEQGSVKIDQTVVHGDYVDDRDTIVKDSVINRSNVGAGGDDKFARLEKLTEMKKEGLIDDAEFKQMKKEILGK